MQTPFGQRRRAITSRYYSRRHGGVRGKTRRLAAVSVPPRQIGTFFSECLILAGPVGNGDLALRIPEKEVPLGAKIH